MNLFYKARSKSFVAPPRGGTSWQMRLHAELESDGAFAASGTTQYLGQGVGWTVRLLGIR